MTLINKKSLSEKPHLCKTILNLSVSPETVPTLIKKKALDELTKNDPDPYFVIEEIIDYTKLANGIEYTLEFWESFISKLKQAPLPGAKSGHTSPYAWWSTGATDFFVVGAQIINKKIQLKMYIPSFGQDSSNETFIKAVKTGVVNFSIVTYPEMSVDYDEEGNVISRKAIRSVKGERNDAVERDMGAMEQKVNIKDPENNIQDDKINNKLEGRVMPEELKLNEIVENLKNRLENGSVSSVNLAKELGLSLVTDVHINAIKTVEEIKKIVGEKPVEAITEMKINAEKVKQQVYDNEREKALFKAFGPLKNKVNNIETDNLVRNAAEPYISKTIQSEIELNKQIEEAKKNPVVEVLQKQNADVYSTQNLIVESGPGNKTANKDFTQETRIKG